MVVNCEQVWREVSNYLEGEVRPALRSAMMSTSAPVCAASRCWKAHANVVALYGDERMLDIPTGFSRGWKKESRRAGASAADGQPGRRGLCRSPH